MNLENLLNNAHSIFNQYPIVLAVIAIVLLLIAYKNPKESFKFALFLLFIAVLFYAISLFGEALSTGSKNKDQMIYKTKKLVD